MLRVLTAAAVFTLCACSDPIQWVEKDLIITPATATVAAGDAPVLFEARLTGYDETILWQLEGPGSLSTDSGPSTSYTAPASATTAAEVTLTATAAGLRATARLHLMPRTVTVNGKAGCDGVPASGALIAINDLEPVVADFQGRFVVPDVAVPYELVAATGLEVVSMPDSDVAEIEVPIGCGAHPANRGWILGTLRNGASHPLPPNTKVAMSASCPECSGPSMLTESPDEDELFRVELFWDGSWTSTATVHALEWEQDATTLTPLNYIGYGSRSDLRVVNDGAMISEEVWLLPVGTFAVAGEVVAPDSGLEDTLRISASVGFLDGTSLSLGTFDLPPEQRSFSLKLPSIPEATFSIEAASLSPVGQWVSEIRGTATVSFSESEAARGLRLPISRGVELLTPASGQVVDGVPEFAWTGPATGSYRLRVGGPGYSSLPYLTVFAGSSTNARVPDLSRVGFQLPNDASLSWGVTWTLTRENELDGPIIAQTQTFYAGPRSFQTAP